jgi:hypothetical protein
MDATKLCFLEHVEKNELCLVGSTSFFQVHNPPRVSFRHINPTPSSYEKEKALSIWKVWTYEATQEVYPEGE